MTTRKYFLSAAVILLLIATGLRAWQLSAQSLWFDEGFSWHAATQPSLVTVLEGDPTNPPFYYLLLHVWVRLVGDSEFSLRTLSLLQGIMLLAGIGALARRWFAPSTALVALGMGVFTPLLWWAAQEARMYNTLALAVLLMTSGYLNLQQAPSRRRAWLTFAGGELLALYTHNTGIVVLGAINLVFVLDWLANLRPSAPDWRILLRWGISHLIIIGLWLPELLARFRNLGDANAALRTPPELSPELIWQSWQAVWAASWEMALDSPPTLQLSAGIMALVLLAGLGALRTSAGRRLWGLLAALYGVLLAALGVLGVNFHGRYLVLLTPLLVIILAAGLNQIIPRRGRSLAGVGVVCAVACIWLSLPGQPHSAYQHDQAREMIRYYVEHLGPDDLVLTWSYAERYELRYYAEKMHLSAPLITLPEAATHSEVIARVNAALPDSLPVRAEINTWYTQASDRRGMLPCLIGHHNPPPSASFTVQGMTTQGYAIQQPLALPAAQPITGDYGPVTVTSVGLPSEVLPADVGICLPVEVSVRATPAEDLRAAGNILTPTGQEIAGADAPLLTAAQQPTRQLHPGDTTHAFLLLHLPQGTPPGRYPATLRVYSPAQPAGLDLRDPVSGAPAGKDLSLGVISLSAGAWPAFTGDCGQPLGERVTLTNCTALDDGATLLAGDPLALTLALQVKPGAQQLTLTLRNAPTAPEASWQSSTTTRLTTTGAFLVWPVLRPPAEATGAAQLVAQIDDHPGVVLARYTVEAAEHRMVPPEVQGRSDAYFAGLGTLYGYAIGGTSLVSGESFEVTLVWQAEGMPAIPYTVTVQLLSPEGVLLAQHDSQPGMGSRPTTGWIDAEYIEDVHHVEFREEHVGYTGPARMIVAVYDQVTGTRLTTRSGADHAILPFELAITTR